MYEYKKTPEQSGVFFVIFFEWKLAIHFTYFINFICLMFIVRGGTKGKGGEIYEPQKSETKRWLVYFNKPLIYLPAPFAPHLPRTQIEDRYNL